MKLPKQLFLPSCSLLLFFLFLLFLQHTGAEQHVFDVSVWPENPVVARGGSLWLNCSTSCREADAKGDLETSLIKERGDNGTGWAAFQLVNITEWVSAAECSFSCYGEHKSVPANIVVYRIPQQVVWDPVPMMEVGRVYNLTCRVADAAPLRNLTVTLLKGKEKLHVETFEDHTAPEAREVVVTHSITAQEKDHHVEVSCHAALDLRPEGPLFEKSSLSKVLEVYGFPMDPQIHTLPYLEANTTITVQCDVVGVFPAEEALFEMAFAEERLKVNTTVLGDTMKAQAAISSLSTGNHTLSCTVTLGPETKSVIETIYVYSFLEPSLEVYPSQTLVNNPVTFVCNSSATQPLSISLQSQNASGRSLATSKHLPLQFTLTAQEEDNGREFVCEAELIIGGDIIIKRTSANLTVFYVPEMDGSMCPDNHTWVEGTRQRLQCMAKGNPEPSVTCIKDSITRNMQREELVNRSHAGIYNCTATNEFGSTTKAVTIHVEYGSELNESGCPNNQTWLEGSLQKLNCQADGIPIPEVSCVKDGKVFDVQKVQNVTQSYAGIYECNATNVHGSSSKMVTIKVEYEPDMDNSSCPYNWTWIVETEQMFTCFAWGDPEPTVECTKNGTSYTPGILQIVTKEYAGIYLCTATNKHGSSSRTVNIQVEYKPEMDESSCPSNWTLVEGELPNFACTAEGVPTPEVVCTKDGLSYHLTQGQGIPAYSGVFWCNATNRHGTVTKAVIVAVETKPQMDDSNCPSNQTWLEGTLHSLSCEANGTPTPVVFCTKEGATEELYRERNISRNDSGIYQCKATNGHGTEKRMVNVQVEYRPIISILAVNASLPIRRGENFTIACHADGYPAANYTWKVPQAPNLNYVENNSTLTVVGAHRQNSGVYKCTASNKHGQQHSQVEIHVEDHWLYIIVVIAIAGATMLVLGGMAGVIYYLKSTACKKGEYNVRDAENSTEATCLNRERPCDVDIYGIQLTRT
ncbi:intercellular adhesion molecule 5 [Anolis sagrei]|uniref:intercellular adhesion molecule 5 n=1 Tax=Anolis sagrei TaxID=38937 RepID=UPI0035217812